MLHTSFFHRIKQDKAPDILSVVVEISQGDFNKYEYDHALGVLRLDRVLYGPLFYPVNYCDIPGTWNKHDKDPLDALLFSTGPIVPGVIATGRVIGAIEMIDNGEIDHKIVCVNAKDPRFDHVHTMEDLTEYQKKDVVTFFELYKIPQHGKKTTEIGKFLTKQEAGMFIQECISEYQKKFAHELNA